MNRRATRLPRLRRRSTKTPAAEMPITPYYEPRSANAAYQLRFCWTGWPSSGRFPSGSSRLIDYVKPLWEGDGLRLLEERWTDEMVQLLFSARPDVSPQFIAARAKGRLVYAGRQNGLKIAFSRKLAVRSVGDNTRRDVEAYIQRQVSKERFADPRFLAVMNQVTLQNPAVDLSLPAESSSGRYWYNLHLVLVVEGRARASDSRFLVQMRDAALNVAAKKGHQVSRLSTMPDHLHAALRPAPFVSPVDVVFAYQNNLAYMLQSSRIWMDSYYVGTFGEYAMHAVRGERPS